MKMRDCPAECGTVDTYEDSADKSRQIRYYSATSIMCHTYSPDSEPEAVSHRRVSTQPVSYSVTDGLCANCFSSIHGMGYVQSTDSLVTFHCRMKTQVFI